MAAGEIRGGLIATVLPPREGFSPAAVGAVGLVVHGLAVADDVVIGERLLGAPFADRRYMQVPRVMWPPVGRVLRYYAGVLKVLRALRPARVEVHNRADLAWRAARALPGARVALFVHNDPQAMRGARDAAARTALLARVQVVCVSDYLRARFMAGVAGGAAQVLPNAIDFSALPEMVPDAARATRFLFAGRIVADKGADAFVRAAGALGPTLPAWGGRMIGADRFRADAPETPFMRALLPAARAAGVEMLGYQPRDRVMREMAQAAVVVVPSRWAEPFGLVALEAMANGAALICSGRGGLREVAGAAALYADPDAPGELEGAMRRLAGDAELRAALAEAGRARALQFGVGAARAALARLR